MAKLTFLNSDLQLIIAHSAKATEWKRSLDETIEVYEATGKAWDFETVIPDAMYKRSTPSLWLVKDCGIYIMTPAVMKSIPADKSHVAFAKGYGPENYDKCRAAVGGDDFVQSFDLTNEMIAAIKGGSNICITITQSSMSVSYMTITK